MNACVFVKRYLMFDIKKHYFEVISSFRLRDILKPRPDRSSRLINDDFRGTADGYADRHKGDTIDKQNKNRICPKLFTRMFNESSSEHI